LGNSINMEEPLNFHIPIRVIEEDIGLCGTFIVDHKLFFHSAIFIIENKCGAMLRHGIITSKYP
jgi:hypothetical protein